jgi:fatty-acid desaturase
MQIKKSIVYLWPFQILSLLGILYSFYAFEWTDILLFLILGHFLGCTSETIGLHRYFSHRSFKVNKIWHIILIFICTLGISGPIVAWASIHRNHHKNSDTDSDPHSPIHRGIFSVFFANWWFYRHTPPTEISDYNNDSLLKFTCDYYYHINVAFILLLIVINPYLLFPLYFYPGIIGSLVSSTVNTYLHRNGITHDSKILAWIIGGDGHHKYYHLHPSESIMPFPDGGKILINLVSKS